MRMDDNADAKRILLASPPADWRRQTGCRRITWLSTVQQALKQHYIMLSEAADLGQNRRLWRMMSTYGATQSYSCMPETTTNERQLTEIYLRVDSFIFIPQFLCFLLPYSRGSDLSCVCMRLGGSIFGQQQQQSGGLSSGPFSFGATSNKGPTFGASAATTTTGI